MDNSIYTVNGVVPLNLFLGGTIDNGNSENWQQQLIDELDLCDTVHPMMINAPRTAREEVEFLMANSDEYSVDEKEEIRKNCIPILNSLGI